MKIRKLCYPILLALISSTAAVAGDFDKCIGYASSLNDFRRADAARADCTKKFQKSITFKNCADAASWMHSAVNRDALRAQCFERYKHRISYDECVGNASRMNFSYNEDTMRNMCWDYFHP